MAKPQQYAALYFNDNSQCQTGTLEEIMEAMDDSDADAHDYTFYRLGEKVNVQLEKKLTLVEEK